MDASKRRGRPVGKDYKEDTEALALVAERLVSDQGLKPSTAMRAVCKSRKWRGQSDEAITDRWLRKWKTLGSDQLEAARQRRAAIEVKPVTVEHIQFANPAISAEFVVRMEQFQAEMARAIEPARRAMERIVGDLNSPGMRAFCERQRKLAEELAASPLFKEMQRMSEQMKNLPQIHIPKHLWGDQDELLR